MPDDLKINIQTAADTAGAEAAAKALQGVGKAAAEAGEEAKKGGKKQAEGAAEAGKQILSLGETTEKGIGIGRMFSEVLQGNFYALGNVTAALKVTGAAIKTSVVGVVLLGLTALSQALPALIEKLGGKKDSLKEGFDAAKEAADKLNEAKLASLQANLDAIKERSANARAEIDQLQAAADKLDDVEMAAELAANKVAHGLTEEQRKTNEYDIRNKYRLARDERKLTAMASAEEVARMEAAQAGEKTTSAAEEFAAARAKVEAAKARRAALQEEKIALEIEQRQLPAGESEIARRQRGLSGGRDAEIRARLRQISADQEALNTPDVLALEQRDVGSMGAREKAFQTAQREQLRSLQGLETLRGKNYLERATMLLQESPALVQRYAERYGTTPDLRSESDPVYRPTTRIRSRFGEVEGVRPGETPEGLRQTAQQIGQKTGAEIAREMADSIRANNQAIIEAFRAQQARAAAELETLRQQLAAARR